MKLIKEYKSSETRFLAFDIETAPMAAEILEPLVPPFDPSEVKVGNLKDPAKVAEKIAEAEVKHKVRFIQDAALSPLTGQVCAFGVRTWFAGNVGSPDETENLVVAQTPVTNLEETILLKAFWETWTTSTNGGRTIWVGHNVLDFDLPFLVIRSRLLGIPVPGDLVRFAGHKYSFSLRVVDTRNLFALGRNLRDLKTSLGYLGGLMGLGGKNGDGKDFASLVNENNEAARAYLARDIELTALLAVRLGIEDLHGHPLPA